MTRLPPIPVAIAAVLILSAVVAVLFAAWRTNRTEQLPAQYPIAPRVLPIVCTTAKACVPLEVAPYVVVRQVRQVQS